MPKALNKRIGIVDGGNPSSEKIEEMALEANCKIIYAVDTYSLQAAKNQLDVVIVSLKADCSLSDVSNDLKRFSKDIQLVIRVDDNLVDRFASLEMLERVLLVNMTDLSLDTWSSIFITDSPPVVLHDDGQIQSTAKIQMDEVIFVDPQSRKLLALIEKLGQTQAPVLFEGPTGSGKEVVAKTLHRLSLRSNGPFIALNCAALPENLAEDMLFGHERGAFTGATRDSQGVFEQARGGTVFLDEIGDMSLALQSKLLRVLQEKEVVRLGGSKKINLDFRLVAATNQHLKNLIEQKRFREDLYFRLSAFKLVVPSLASRPLDIIPLANSLASKYSDSNIDFKPEALDQLHKYGWPGNVRELENVIQRAVVFAEQGLIGVEHLIFDELTSYETFLPETHQVNRYASTFSTGINAASYESKPLSGDLQSAVRASEYDVIMDAIRSTRTREQAANKLGISPRTLRYKMAKLRDSHSSNLTDCA